MREARSAAVEPPPPNPLLHALGAHLQTIAGLRDELEVLEEGHAENVAAYLSGRLNLREMNSIRAAYLPYRRQLIADLHRACDAATVYLAGVQ